jgi:DNA-directed RNA polymerase specialized sigma24 family protein
MKTHSNLTEEELRKLIEWLGPDDATAGGRYEFIRQGLILFFVHRQCLDAEDLADETINRVAKKLKELAGHYEGEPVRYFHGVAKKVFLEYVRRPPPRRAEPHVEERDPRDEAYHNCLDECLGRLTSENRELILAYYDAMTKNAAARKSLRERMNLNAGALRARTFRVRAALEKCVRECIAWHPET